MTDARRSTLSNDSSDSDDSANVEYYRLKVQDLMKMLAHYHKNIKCEQVKNESLQSVVDSMRDVRQTSGELQLQLQRKDGIIAVLQNRLAHLGASTEISLSPDESIVLPSQANFDSLVHENRKLKENLKYTSFDPNGYEILQSQLRTQQNNFHELRAKHKSLYEDHEKLKKTLQSSSDEKDAQIYELTEQLKDAERNTEVHSTLCQSLTDETQELRDQLQQMVLHCRKLERNLTHIRKAQTQALDCSSVEQSSSKNEDHSGEQSETIKLKNENRQLRAELRSCKKELEKIVSYNASWKTYDQQRETKVISLQKEITELTDKLAKARAAQDTGFSSKQQQEVDKIVLQYKGKVEEAEKQRQLVEDENRDLRRSRLQLQRTVEDKQKDIQELRQNMQALSDQAEENASYKERTELLETQLKIFNEDFQSERHEKEKAESRLARVETELRYYKDHSERHQRSQMDDLAQRRQDAVERYRRQYEMQHQVQFLSRQAHNAQPFHAGFRIEADGIESREEAGEDMIDMPVFKREPPIRAAGGVSNMRHASTTGNIHTSSNQYTANTITKPQTVGNFDMRRDSGFDSHPQDRSIFDDSRSEIITTEKSRDTFHTGTTSKKPVFDVGTNDNETLQCPKCELVFKANQHLDLLDHINECCV